MYKFNPKLCDNMREEHVSLSNVEASDLFQEIKKYLEDLKLDIIHEEKFDKFWSIKAYRGGVVNTITGSVRDVEVMISGSDKNYDLVLRTGAWGRDIFVPGALAGLMAGGIGAGVVAGLEIFRAYSFEKNFWQWLTNKVNELGRGNISMTGPTVVKTLDDKDSGKQS